MSKTFRTCLLTLAGVVTLAATVVAAEAAATDAVPTKDNPIRYRAFGVQMNAGRSGTVQIAIERWTTDAERNAILGVVATTTEKRGRGQDKLLATLQHVAPRVGYIRLANTRGWDLKYAWPSTLPDGTRQIVIATDKPVSFLAAYSNARTMDYPFTLVQMRFPAAGGEGEGKMLTRTAITVKDGQLEIELYDQQPTRLTKITQTQDKD